MKKDYSESVHFYGRIWVATAIILLLMVPAAISVYFNAWPNWTYVFKGLLGVAPIYWTVGIIEVFTYAPMLGTGGTYLGFVTGNLASLKVPCAINAMEAANVQANSEEGDVVSTIAIATSSIVTTLIIAVGALMLRHITPVLQSEALRPAFAYITPALIGALAVVYFAKNWKLALPPALVMVVVFSAVPGLGSSVGIMVPVGVLIALGAGRIMYNKGWL